MHWAAFTLGLFLPGTAVQLLSVKWYYEDGDDRRCYLSVIHILHLGIFKRYEPCAYRHISKEVFNSLSIYWRYFGVLPE